MSSNKDTTDLFECDSNTVTDQETTTTTELTQRIKKSSTSESRQIKFEKAQRCLENAALVSKKIREHRRATAELLGKPFEDDIVDNISELASTMSEKTGYSVSTDVSAPLSVQEALNIPGISESLANTLKQKELLMERIKQYKEISKRSAPKSSAIKKEQGSIKTKDSNVESVQSIIKEKENTISILQVRIKALETSIINLQEQIQEKDQIIDAKNKATALISDSLSQKEKDTINLLEDTKQQMSEMQSNFCKMENEWKDDKEKFCSIIKDKDTEIDHLQDRIKNLEARNLELETFNLELLAKSVEANEMINKLEEKLKSVYIKSQNDDDKEEKGSAEISKMNELTKKIELLEQLNYEIRLTNKDLEHKLAGINHDTSKAPSSPSKLNPQNTTRKTGRNSKQKSPWSNLTASQETHENKSFKNEICRLESLVKSLNKDILEKEYEIAEKDSILRDLEAKLKENMTNINPIQSVTEFKVERVHIGVSTEMITLDQNILSEPTDTICSDEIIDLKEKLYNAITQNEKLNKEIDAANKNMIKVKASNKLKLKQMQKTIDDFSKISDANAEIIKLTKEVNQLSQKIAELEEEKGNLQLHLVDYDSGRITESDLYKKLLDMENLSESRLKAINVLETQKFGLVQELHEMKQKNLELEDKLTDILQTQNEQISSEIKFVNLEEQIDALTASKSELEIVNENLKLDNDQLNEKIQSLIDSKNDLNNKLDHCIQENIELSEKLEKLSAEKVSSAESIEIVELFSSPEKSELEDFGKASPKIDKVEGSSQFPEAVIENNDNIEKIVLERAELNEKIKIFTAERKEVLEKLNNITLENKQLKEKINDLNNDMIKLKDINSNLISENLELTNSYTELANQIEALKVERIELIKNSSIMDPESLNLDVISVNTGDTQENLIADKALNKSKSLKHFTKEILKLKNVIKDREAEIADCQMKILFLDEQNKKQSEVLLNNNNLASKVKSLSADISNTLVVNNELKISNELLADQLEKLKLSQSEALEIRESKISKLEEKLQEYEKQVCEHANILSHKDKEIYDYLNQITQLNELSQKMKNTINLLEEKSEKYNNETTNALNNQIMSYQKKLIDYEDKMKAIEEDNINMKSMKHSLETKILNFEIEIKNLKKTLADNEALINSLQNSHKKHVEDMANVLYQSKERDEEINEIKLQLRKESIENEKLHQLSIQDKIVIEEGNKFIENLNTQLQTAESKLAALSENNDKYIQMENKNIELMEKLKKYALNIKKKNSMFSELEQKYENVLKEVQMKTEQLENISSSNNSLIVLQEEVLNSKQIIEKLNLEVLHLNEQRNVELDSIKIEKFKLEKDLKDCKEQNSTMKHDIHLLEEKLNITNNDYTRLQSEYTAICNEIQQKEFELKKTIDNSQTKIRDFENILNLKETFIAELSTQIQSKEKKIVDLQLAFEAKLKEKDLVIESLESEITNYKQSLSRLEIIVSDLEGKRNMMPGDDISELDNQLQEKRKAYVDYCDQENYLVDRLACLLEHENRCQNEFDNLENENKYLKLVIEKTSEENRNFKKEIGRLNEHIKGLSEKLETFDSTQTQLSLCQSKIHELETNFKRLTDEHNSTLVLSKVEIDELEKEFNIQIENALKEKKLLRDKCQQISDHVENLENQLCDYAKIIDDLNRDLDQLKSTNRTLIENNSQADLNSNHIKQCLNEINNLNNIIGSKNSEISSIRDEMNAHKTEYISIINSLEMKIQTLSTELDEAYEKNKILVTDASEKNHSCEVLKEILEKKENQLKALSQKKLTFEMNIPKTEGICITSTIEPFNPELNDSETKVEDNSNNANLSGYFDIVSNKQVDPFNSEEGWGLGEGANSFHTTQDYFTPTNIENTFQKEISTLKKDLEITKNKLLKAVKKIKELKTYNETLRKDLSMANNVSSLDNTIEEVLRNKIHELEFKIENLNSELSKERIEKEALKTQNDVIMNANEKLLETKEKLESDVELWKYNFKHVNNKLETMDWDKNINTVDNKIVKFIDSNQEVAVKKLEKENQQLSLLVNELHLTISKMSSQKNLKMEAQLSDTENLTKDIENIETYKKEIETLKSSYKLLEDKYDFLNQTSSKANLIIHDCVLATKQINDKCCRDALEIQGDFKISESQPQQELLLHLHSSLKEIAYQVDELVTKNKALEENLEKSKLLFSKLEECNKNLVDEKNKWYTKTLELQSSLSNALDQGIEEELYRKELDIRNQLDLSQAAQATNNLMIMRERDELQKQLNEKEESFITLQNKYLDTVNELEMLRLEHENLTLQQKSEICSLEQKYKEVNKILQNINDNNETHTINALSISLDEEKRCTSELKSLVENLKNKLKNAEEHISDITDQLHHKDQEIGLKIHDFSVVLEQKNYEITRTHKELDDLQKKLEDITFEKESELAILRLKIHDDNKLKIELEQEITEMTELLNQKNNECADFCRQIKDLNEKLEEQRIQIEQFQNLLQSQEYELVTLKEELGNMQTSLSSKIVKQSSVTEGSKFDVMSTNNETELVPKAELDLAYYVIHQRDVRCEELTVELAQLLEERDTLQLRLSDSLRTYEELKETCKSAGVNFTTSSCQPTSETSVIPVKDQQTLSAEYLEKFRDEMDPEKPKLQAKLSELKSVRHSRDVRLRHQSEQRQMDLRLLQQDIASLPPEAVTQLTQAHQNLPRDAQSTSTVLLNWIRGKSTSKGVQDM